MEVRLIIIFVVILGSCGNKSTQKLEADFNNPAEQIEGTDFSPVDTIKLDSAYYYFEYLNSERFLVKWGNSFFENCSQDTFDIFSNGYLSHLEYNNKWILLQQSCGTNCVLNVILPLVPNTKELSFMPVVYNNINREIIITTKNPSKGVFEIIDFGSNTRKDVLLNDLCPAIDKSSCIDSISINGNTLMFFYEGSKWNISNPDKRSEAIRLGFK